MIFLYTALFQTIVKLLHEAIDVNARDESNDAPIHAIARRPVSKQKFECLMSLLIHTPANDLDVNLTTVDGDTALHLVVKVRSCTGFGFILDAFAEP